MSLNRLLILLLMSPVLSIAGRFEPAPKGQPAHCIKVISCEEMYAVKPSGDTVHILLNNIDCPELDQPFGDSALAFVIEECDGKDIDLYFENDTVTDVAGLHQTLTTTLLLKGYAWLKKDKSFGGLLNIKTSDFENAARDGNAGLWSLPNPVAPWDWRQMSLKEKVRYYINFDYQKMFENRKQVNNE